EVPDEQARVSLARRAEVLLYPQVQLDAVAAEPAATPGGQSRRLGDLAQAQHPIVEGAQDGFASRRAGQLNMMDHVHLQAATPVRAGRRPSPPGAALVSISRY